MCVRVCVDEEGSEEEGLLITVTLGCVCVCVCVDEEGSEEEGLLITITLDCVCVSVCVHIYSILFVI